MVKVTDVDLVIILANCLDNAIEAIEKIDQPALKKIKVVIMSEKAGILIMVENPVLEELDLNKLETKKNEKENHGFGMQKMKDTVQKYGGSFQVEIKEQRFIVKIFLPN